MIGSKSLEVLNRWASEALAKEGAGSDSQAHAAQPSNDPPAAIRTRANRGGSGRRCICRPSGVIWSRSSAPSRSSSVMAEAMRASDGRSNHSNVVVSALALSDVEGPHARIESNGPDRSMR